MVRLGLYLFCLGVLTSLLVFHGFSDASAATLRVPQDYSTISAAANLAQTGDSILVWRDNDGEYPNEQINLRQGVVMRGMEETSGAVMRLHGCAINLMEEPLIPDTTRVEHFSIFNPIFREAIQVFTPRSAITDCRIQTSGPYDRTAVRIWKGGLVSRNYFWGLGESNAIEARQGTVVVMWNMFEALFMISDN